MRLSILILSFSLCSSCFAEQKQSDSELRTKIIGIWSATYKHDNFYLYGESNYKNDGTVVGRGIICPDNKCEDTNYEEIYEIKNSYLILTTTSEGDVDIPVGFVIRDKIISIDDSTLILENEKGVQFVRKKVSTSKYFSK